MRGVGHDSIKKISTKLNGKDEFFFCQIHFPGLHFKRRQVSGFGEKEYVTGMYGFLGGGGFRMRLDEMRIRVVHEKTVCKVSIPCSKK